MTTKESRRVDEESPAEPMPLFYWLIGIGIVIFITGILLGLAVKKWL